MPTGKDAEGTAPDVASGEPELVLDLGSDAVALLRREALGCRELARAEIGPDGSVQGVSELVRAAGGGAGRTAPKVVLWLPPEQVLARRIALPDEPTARSATAVEHVSAATGQRPEDLTIDIASRGPDGLSMVVAAFSQSCREACAYAEGWGFAPVAISTAVEASSFGAAGPRFAAQPTADAPSIPGPAPTEASAPRQVARAREGDPADGDAPTAQGRPVGDGAWSAQRDAKPDARPSRAPRWIGFLAVLAVVSGALIYGTAWETGERSSSNQSQQTADTGKKPASPDAARRRIDAPAATPARETATAATAPAGETVTGLAPVSGAPAPTPLASAAPPRDVAAPAALDPAVVGTEAPVPPASGPALGHPPAAVPPAALASPASAGGRPETRFFAEILAATKATREAAIADEVSGQADARLNAAPAIWKQAPGRPEAGSPSLASRAITTPEARADGPDGAALPPGSDVLLAELDASALAPPRSAAPRRRPGESEAASEEPAPAAGEAEGGEPEIAPAEISEPTSDEARADAGSETDETTAASELAPDNAPGPRLRGSGVAVGAAEPDRADATEAEVAPAPDSDANPDESAPSTDQAVAAAPPPRNRPDGLGAPIRPSKRHGGSGPAVQALPQIGRSAQKKVQRAAVEQGLPLDRMALIGILNLETGRQALLRLPNGRYERLKVGDNVEGWKVSSIGADAMRLSRNGEERTLILVNR